MWCKLCGVTSVVQTMWCRLCDASYVVKSTWCKLCGVSHVVQTQGRAPGARGAHGRQRGETSADPPSARAAHEAPTERAPAETSGDPPGSSSSTGGNP